MTRRIWDCIKSHLRPYSTHPFNWDKNDKPDGSQWQLVQKLSASPKYQKLHELVCERNEKCIVIAVKTHYFLTNYFLISTNFSHFNSIEWKGKIPEVIPMKGICPHQGQTTTTGTLCHTLFKQCMGSFTFHIVVNKEELQDGPYSLSIIILIWEDLRA